MELVKREDHWALYNEDGHKIAATIPGCNSKLSLKNCQAIENGYDLDELAEKEVSYLPNSVKLEAELECIEIYKEGFQKALEILGDKKFNEEDIKKAIAFDQYHFEYGEITSCKKDEEKEEFIQSLQQTEWDVTIVTKNSRTGKIVNSDYDLEWDEDGLCDVAIPKLDDNGCLILKRKV